METELQSTTREQQVYERMGELLASRRQRMRIVAASHLSDLAESIRRPHEEGLFDETFYAEEMATFKFSFPDEMPAPRSLIVVATPHPPTPVIFHHQGREYALWVPPTYSGYKTIPPEILSTLGPMMAEYGYQIVHAPRIPFKRMVVSSGLGRYGRNNLTYIEGMGSFFELEAFYSDLPCPVDQWQEPQVLERCSTCSACIKLCPTAAIAPDRFLIHAERCLTFHNERPAEIPFPDWIKKSAHNAIIGCMTCQVVCPENVVVKKWQTEPVEFSEGETDLLLQGHGPEVLSALMVEKLTRIGLLNSWKLLPRNLGAFLS